VKISIFLKVFSSFLQRIFGTAFFALNYLLYILPMPMIILLAEELRKKFFYGRLGKEWK